jgi:hypothetical protein
MLLGLHVHMQSTVDKQSDVVRSVCAYRWLHRCVDWVLFHPQRTNMQVEHGHGMQVHASDCRDGPAAGMLNVVWPMLW